MVDLGLLPRLAAALEVLPVLLLNTDSAEVLGTPVPLPVYHLTPARTLTLVSQLSLGNSEALTNSSIDYSQCL